MFYRLKQQQHQSPLRQLIQALNLPLSKSYTDEELREKYELLITAVYKPCNINLSNKKIYTQNDSKVEQTNANTQQYIKDGVEDENHEKSSSSSDDDTWKSKINTIEQSMEQDKQEIYIGGVSIREIKEKYYNYFNSKNQAINKEIQQKSRARAFLATDIQLNPFHITQYYAIKPNTINDVSIRVKTAKSSLLLGSKQVNYTTQRGRDSYQNEDEIQKANLSSLVKIKSIYTDHQNLAIQVDTKI
ncbi:UNKNOWN [Stylonychia lemnae]|uniref:Uncharacterized protein n=1 Tax=Stylonychia lemnae TaxID=5949 RepID=A0A078AF83_STYLE|nr:UNKNOWN [Stylonychia lemnae]|eukprot:CDW80187.1 UNKNOWN [Stylonychia lemnae]